MPTVSTVIRDDNKNELEFYLTDDNLIRIFVGRGDDDHFWQNIELDKKTLEILIKKLTEYKDEMTEFSSD